jgi:hypothetical protein
MYGKWMTLLCPRVDVPLAELHLRSYPIYGTDAEP